MDHRARSRLAIAVVVGGAVAALVLLFSLAPTEEAAAPEQTPKPGISIDAKEIRTAPQVSDARRKATTKAVAALLKSFYTRAFVHPAANDSSGSAAAESTPWPGPASRVASLLNRPARLALADSRDVLDAAEDLSVFSGTVSFSGLITFDGPRSTDALIDVDFSGLAAPVGRTAPVAKMRHIGQLHLERTDDGWRIDGFDLELKTRPAPTPEPTGR